MTVGFVLLCHEALHRTAQVARHWAGAGCPVVIHIDKRVPADKAASLRSTMAEFGNVRFSARHACEWGTWSLVAASQTASELMLQEFPEVSHIYLVSGSCLPLRPIDELRHYLAQNPRTDFIESVTTEDVPWTVGGLDEERFVLRFPFSWKKHRRLFDGYVRLQRRIGFKRRIPEGIVPHLGSQWWCLTRETLTGILEHKQRREFDTYFKKVWIPDESYYQSLARVVSGRIESRSLTLSKFDFQGKPHIFYDDHLQLLRRSDCFVARKIWPSANRLYEAFLTEGGRAVNMAEPNPGKIDRVFSKAVDRRTRGRAGLYMQSRYPNYGWENGLTCATYSVFQGFGDLFADFQGWLHRATGSRVHGNLYAPERAEFADGQTVYAGALSDCARLRDHAPRAFLTNLIWNTRGERQCFLYGPRDTFDVLWLIAEDPNAFVSLISGAWAVPLYRSQRPFAELRKEAARLQKLESKQIEVLRGAHVKARVRIWTMADFVDSPMEPLQTIIDEIGPRSSRRLTEAPKMHDLSGFGQFLQDLKNQGMHPHLMGDFQVQAGEDGGHQETRKPYLVM